MPTPTVYTPTDFQWPLLQSKTEMKFKSGLFNVSAEFIRPVGNTSLPETIETSIGLVDVWPNPTVSVGTDGFERINATGYGVWDANLTEVTWGLAVGRIHALAIKNTVQTEAEMYGKYIEGCFFDTASVKKIGSQVPQIPSRNGVSGLRVYNPNSEDVTDLVFNVSSFFPTITASSFNGVFNATLAIVTRPASARQTTFGEDIVETEVTYEIVSATLNFGTFIPKPTP
jgi:hypothetical protein